MRKLAHIEIIDNLEPIEGADNIEVASVLGWKVIVKKNEFKIGDQAVYFEIDSIVPERPEFEFLRPRKFRVRTIKLKKQISQGLLIPVPVAFGDPKIKTGTVGEDLTEKLGVTHYDPESNLHASNESSKPRGPIVRFLFRYKIFRKFWNTFFNDRIKGHYPEFIVKTDEERCQNLHWNRFRELNGHLPFIVSEKLDGQSFTAFVKNIPGNFGLKKLIFGVCSRNQWLKTPNESNWWKIARKTEMENILLEEYANTGRELCIQGECCGDGIQKNKYKISGLRLFVFNIVDITDPSNRINWSQEAIDSFCTKNGLETVPVLDRNFKLPETVAEMVSYADGKSIVYPDAIREGVVVRHYETSGFKISFKAISNKFLLKEED